ASPIVSSTSRVVQSEKTIWRGTRSASQNVPVKRRPRTGGNDRGRELDMAVVAGVAVLKGILPGQFTPFARQAAWSDHHSGTPAASKAQTTGTARARAPAHIAARDGLDPMGS